MNVEIREMTDSRVGAPTRSSSRIPVRRVMAAPTPTPGSTKILRRSPRVADPSSSRRTRTAPTSMTRSNSGSNPVVSRSSATMSRAGPF
jgi:hypothetical protein